MGDFALFKMSKHTNLDIKDAACLHIVHNLQYPTSRPTTKLTPTTTVRARNNDSLPLLAGKYGNRQSRPPNDVIKRMKARVAWKQKESEPLGIAQLATQNKACGREIT